MTGKPIVDKNLIEQIKQKYLERNQKRDLLIFLLSINTGIKLTELLKLAIFITFLYYNSLYTLAKKV